jgi:hypothetical protein
MSIRVLRQVFARYAIKGAPGQKLLLEDIYYAIEARFPYFRTAPSGWKVSFRSFFLLCHSLVCCGELRRERRLLIFNHICLGRRRTSRRASQRQSLCACISIYNLAGNWIGLAPSLLYYEPSLSLPPIYSRALLILELCPPQPLLESML